MGVFVVAQGRGHLRVVNAQFGQHRAGQHELDVVAKKALLASDLADRREHEAADLSCATGDGIWHRKDLSDVLVELQVEVAKARPYVRR